MKTFIILITLLWITNLAAQNQAPQVTNVSFLQRDDGTFIVDIYYDVNDPDGNPMNISMKVTSDIGATWDFTCNNITGDLGPGITNGTGKHIMWDFAAEHPQTFGKKFKIKIIADDQACPGTPTVTYEGKVYNTVQIGTQCWLRENLDVGNMVVEFSGQTNNGIIEKFCYNNDPSNCSSYGGLYKWPEAMQYNTASGSQGICPVGWYIPTEQEFINLNDAVNWDGNALKREDQGSSGGQGTNTSGFSALLAGHRDFYGFSSITEYGMIWSSTEEGSTIAIHEHLRYYDNNIWVVGDNKTWYAFSVRCVKN